MMTQKITPIGMFISLTTRENLKSMYVILSGGLLYANHNLSQCKDYTVLTQQTLPSHYITFLFFLVISLIPPSTTLTALWYQGGCLEESEWGVLWSSAQLSYHSDILVGSKLTLYNHLQECHLWKQSRKSLVFTSNKYTSQQFFLVKVGLMNILPV